MSANSANFLHQYSIFATVSRISRDNPVIDAVITAFIRYFRQPLSLKTLLNKKFIPNKYKVGAATAKIMELGIFAGGKKEYTINTSIAQNQNIIPAVKEIISFNPIENCIIITPYHYLTECRPPP